VDSDKLRRERVEVWAQVRAAIAVADELTREGRRLAAQEERADDDLITAGAPRPEREGKGPPAAYSRRRQELRAALTTGLRTLLVRYIGEQQAAHALVPLVIACDERERLALGPLAKRWTLPRLQVELLEIDDGGDRFYEALEGHLEGSGTHVMVFELYLLCLKQGFEGRFAGRQAERQAVIDRLGERLRREDPRRALASAGGVGVPAIAPDTDEARDGRRRKVSFVAFPYRYYAGVVCAALALFLMLRWRSNAVVDRSALGCTCSAAAQDNPEQCLDARAR
jgi:type IV/VI secretion system ImpK/VasF family protein